MPRSLARAKRALLPVMHQIYIAILTIRFLEDESDTTTTSEL